MPENMRTGDGGGTLCDASLAGLDANKVSRTYIAAESCQVSAADSLGPSTPTRNSHPCKLILRKR